MIIIMSYENFRSVIYRAIERNTGMNPQDFIDMPLDKQRRYMEKRAGRRMTISGVGLDNLLSREQVNRMVDEALV